MSISSVSSSSWLQQLSQSTSQTGQSRPAPPPGPPPGGGGKMMSAVSSTLSELGIDVSSLTASTSTSSTDATSSSDETSDPAQALGAFMQTLMSALRSQSGSGDAESGDSAASSISKAHKGPPDMAADLQSLIQQLQSSDTSSSDDGSSDLEASFKNLVSSLGGDSSSASLGSFLSALSSKIPDMSSKGSLVQTQA